MKKPSKILNRSTLIIFGVLILLSFLAFLVSIAPWYFSTDTIPFERIDLIINSLNLVALAIAITRFIQLRQVPKMRIRIANITNGTYEFLDGDTLKGGISRRTNSGTSKGNKDARQISNYDFEFRLVVENLGRIAARDIRMILTLYHAVPEKAFNLAPPFDKPVLILDREENDLVWKSMTGNINNFDLPYVMRGGNEFLVYGRKKGVQMELSFLDEVGQFRLSIPVEEGMEDNRTVGMIVVLEGGNFERLMKVIYFQPISPKK